MRRVVSLMAAGVVLATACAACGGRVNPVTFGSTPVMRAALDRELGAIGSNSLYVTRIEDRIGMPVRDAHGDIVAPVVAEVLSNDVRFLAAQKVAAAKQFRLKPSDLGPGPALLAAEGDAGSAHIFFSFPRWYQDELVRRSATVIGLRTLLSSDTAPEAYYKTHHDEYARACEWDIVTVSRQDADTARARIVAGESFPTVARDVSLDKGTGPKGGNLGCNERKMLVPELDDPAFTMGIGEVTQPILVDTHYHLLTVTSRDTPPLDWIHGEIQAAIDALGQQRFDSLVRIALETTPTRVAPAFGTWDRVNLRVSPPAQPSPSMSPGPARTPMVAHTSSQVDPYFQAGQQIFITDGGFRPRALVSALDVAITWTNETSVPQLVRLQGGAVIGPIAPHATSSYTPHEAISIVYSLVRSPATRGTIQVETPAD